MKAAWFLAALLSAGLAAFPAMAAQGWAQENSSWLYYDSNRNKVYNELELQARVDILTEEYRKSVKAEVLT